MVEAEFLIGRGAFPETVEAQLDHVRDQNPFHAARVHGVFPRLLNGALVPARHDCIEVAGIRALQLEWCHDVRRLAAKAAKRCVETLKGEGAEIIVCLSHSGTGDSLASSEDEELAKATRSFSSARLGVTISARTSSA